MIRLALACLTLLAAVPAPALRPELAKLLSTHLKFSQGDLNDLQSGKVVKHGLSTSAPGEIAVVGGVRVRAPLRRLLDGVRDITRFKSGPAVLEIGRFSDPPVASDLNALTVTPEDFDAGDCRIGDCDVRLPAEAIERVPRDRAGTDGVQRQAETERWFKQVLLEHVSAYWSGSANRIRRYDDDSPSVEPGKEFDAALKNAPEAGALVPGLPAHLTDFPAHRLENVEDFLYWSKEKFGLGPFITVTQVTIVCPGDTICVIASKDVYSSRYLDASLSLTIASVDPGDPSAFYLVYSNRSRASALKGLFGSVRKAIAERRARGGLDETLKSVKARLEAR
jgi:hypothetical protein